MAETINLTAKVSIDDKELKNVNKNLDETGKKVEAVGDKAKKSKKGLGVMATGVKGIGTALKSAGIGIFLSLMAALIALFKQNQEVVDFFNKAMKTLSILFNKFTESIGPLKDALTGVFNDPKKALLEFAGLVQQYIIDNFNRMLDAVGLIGSAFKKLFAGDFKGALEDAGKGIYDLAVSTNPLLLILEETTKAVIKVGEAAVDTYNEAADAADKFIEKQNELLLREAELNKMVAKNKSTIQDLKLVRDDENKSMEERIKAAEDINKLIQQETDASIALEEAKLAQMKADLDLTNTTIEDKVAIANQEAQLDNLRAAASTRQRENLLKINALEKKNAADKQKILDEEYAAAEEAIDKDLERIKSWRERKKALQAEWRLEDAETDEELYEELVKQEEKRFETYMKNDDLTKQEKEFAEEEHQRRIQEIKDKYGKKDLKNSALIQKEKADKVLAGLDIAKQAVGVYSKFLDMQMNKELKDAGDNEAKKEQIRKEYGKKKKRAAIIDAIIGTAMAVVNALATVPFMPMGLAMAVIAGAAGAVQIATISQQQFAQGGVLEGPTHAQGGIPTAFGELEGGEGIITASAMSNPSLRNLASLANTGGGGTDFSTGDGSVKLSSDSIAMIVGGINDKKVYVSETDITSTQNRVSVIENEAVL